MTDSVRTALDGHVGLLEITRPPHNFLDADSIGEIADALEALTEDASCRAVVIASEGRSFCAGANFGRGGQTAGRGEAGDSFRSNTSRFYDAAARIFAAPRPLVAAVHGPAVGAGLGLALACDLRVTCPEAFFAGNFVRLGIHPGFAITVTLPALIGPGRAADMLLTGRRVPGNEALEFGLAERCVSRDEVRPAAMALATEIAEAAPLAVAATRRTLRAGLLDQIRPALENELEQQAGLISTADAAEGIAAMLARRTPDFSGR